MERTDSIFRTAARGTGIFAAVLCAGVALAACRYLLPGAAMPDVITGNAHRLPWLIVHAGTAATALLVGPWQFWSRLRTRRPRLHRWMGRTYVVACLIAGTSGLVLALGASTGAVSTAGFGLLAIAWLYTTTMAWRLATQRDFAAHRRWMIRSFALTFAAVTLRLYVPVAVMLPVQFEDAYRAISFLCWVPNLLVVELFLLQPLKRFTAWQMMSRTWSRSRCRACCPANRRCMDPAPTICAPR